MVEEGTEPLARVVEAAKDHLMRTRPGEGEHRTQSVARVRRIEDRRHGAEFRQEGEQGGGLTFVVRAWLVVRRARIEDHQVDGLGAQGMVQIGPVGDLDQLVIGREDGAESPQRGRGQSSGHMHERERGGRLKVRRRPQETKN